MKSRRRRSSPRGKRNSGKHPVDHWRKRLGDALRRLWQRWQRSTEERRTLKARARFWSEVRAGQREAQARHQP